MLDLIIFILPGFFSLYLLIISDKNKIKKSSADYWIFLCVACLVAGLSLFISLLAVTLLENLITLPVGWSQKLITSLYLSQPIVGKLILFKHYIFSFGVVYLLVKIFQNRKFVLYIDGTEATHKFLQEYVGLKSQNSVMIFLKSNKILIGALVDADLHKNIDDDSLTIRPIISAIRDKDSGKMKVTTINFTLQIDDKGKATLTPIFDEIIRAWCVSTHKIAII